MKVLAVEESVYNKIKNLARERQTSLSEIMRQEMPAFVEGLDKKEFRKMKYSKKEMPKVEAPATIEAGMVLENRSLINLCLDLVELDMDAPENKDFVENTMKQLGTKVDNYINLHSFADSQVDRIKNEVKHLMKQVAAFERIQTALKDRALYALKTMDVKKIKSESGHEMVIRTADSVQITSEQLLPSWAINTVTTTTPNKLKIREALKEGEKIEGAFLVTKEYVAFK
jgi:hypothetical protein